MGDAPTTYQPRRTDCGTTAGDVSVAAHFGRATPVSAAPATVIRPNDALTLRTQRC